MRYQTDVRLWSKVISASASDGIARIMDYEIRTSFKSHNASYGAKNDYVSKFSIRFYNDDFDGTITFSAKLTTIGEGQFMIRQLPFATFWFDLPEETKFEWDLKTDKLEEFENMVTVLYLVLS